jgi:hypothetical protein
MAALREQWLAMDDTAAETELLKYVTGAKVPTVPEWDASAQLFYGTAALKRANRVRADLSAFATVRDALRPREGEGGRPFPLIDWGQLRTGFEGIVPK